MQLVVKLVNKPSPNPYLGIRDGLSLPTELCERLLQYQILEECPLDTRFVSIFEDTGCTRLKRLSLKWCSLKGTEAEILFRHELKELELIRMKVKFLYIIIFKFILNLNFPLTGNTRCQEDTQRLFTTVNSSNSFRVHRFLPSFRERRGDPDNGPEAPQARP